MRVGMEGKRKSKEQPDHPARAARTRVFNEARSLAMCMARMATCVCSAALVRTRSEKTRRGSLGKSGPKRSTICFLHVRLGR